jgi:hypothetical protein
MGFTIKDLNRDGGVDALDVNAWHWRPTLAIIESMGFLDETRTILMQYNGVTVSFSAAEARAIAAWIDEHHLSRMDANTRLMLDGSDTQVPDEVGFHRDDLSLNYSTNRIWLEQFRDFCRRCDGFEVS